MHILTIDVGTSSMRGIVFQENGESVIKHQVRYLSCFPSPDCVEQNPADWKHAMMQILKVTSIQAEEKKITIDAIVLTSQRSSVIPVDADGKPLTNAIMWQDTRTKAICEDLQDCNDEIFHICGAKMNTVFSAPKIAWFKKEHPQIYKQANKFIGIADYLIWLLTGRFCTDYTYGSRTLLMDLKKRKWSNRLLEIFQIEEDKLCELVEPGSICGRLRKDLALETGLSPEIPIITAGGDQQCAVIGKGVIKAGNLSITNGTGGFLVATCDHVPNNLKMDVICNVSAMKDAYIIETNTLTCSAAFDWFLKNFYDMSRTSYREINSIIESVEPGAGGCKVLPYFQGRSTPDWNQSARAVFSNIQLGTTRDDMLKALLESICYEMKNNMDIMEQYVSIKEIYVGGGLSNSSVFNQIQADVYNKQIFHTGIEEDTAVGAFMSAAVTLGWYSSLQEAFEQIINHKVVEQYTPNIELTEFYKKLRQEMNELYQKMM